MARCTLLLPWRRRTLLTPIILLLQKKGIAPLEMTCILSSRVTDIRLLTAYRRTWKNWRPLRWNRQNRRILLLRRLPNRCVMKSDSKSLFIIKRVYHALLKKWRKGALRSAFPLFISEKKAAGEAAFLYFPQRENPVFSFDWKNGKSCPFLVIKPERAA